MDCAQEAGLLQQTLDSSRATLELVAHKRAAQTWLKPAVETETGTEQLYDLLEERVAQPSFAERLAAERRRQQATVVAVGLPEAAAAAGSQPQPGSPGAEVLQRDWWELKPDGAVTTVVNETTGDYVLVEREDVVDALSQFIAAYLTTLPEARNLDPRQLQAAISTTLKELKKSRVRRIIDWGRVLYRVGAVGYGAFTAFSNPWVAKAVLAALWTFVRAVGRWAF
ncbi:hypothetical protein N2152v2_008810 [Parachlorella kessleri]